MSALWLVAAAFGGDEVPTPDLRADTPSLAGWAAQQIAEGNPDGAQQALEEVKRRVDAGEHLPPDLLDEAIVQLAEIHYAAGDTSGTATIFAWLFAHHPEATINEYHHDASLVGEFFKAKEEARQKPKPKRPRLPWWGYAPFGAPQIGQGEVAFGAGFAVAQGLLASASLVTFFEAVRFQGPWWAVRPLPRNADPEESARHDWLLWGVNFPSTIGFYGLWLTSVAVGGRTWAEDHPITVTVTLSRDEIGFGIVGALP
jgi:hypothetical protein